MMRAPARRSGHVSKQSSAESVLSPGPGSRDEGPAGHDVGPAARSARKGEEPRAPPLVLPLMSQRPFHGPVPCGALVGQAGPKTSEVTAVGAATLSSPTSHIRGRRRPGWGQGRVPRPGPSALPAPTGRRGAIASSASCTEGYGHRPPGAELVGVHPHSPCAWTLLREPTAPRSGSGSWRDWPACSASSSAAVAVEPAADGPQANPRSGHAAPRAHHAAVRLDGSPASHDDCAVTPPPGRPTRRNGSGASVGPRARVGTVVRGPDRRAPATGRTSACPTSIDRT